MGRWREILRWVRYAVNKSGTSVAARQAEPTFSADYVFVTSCSSGKCVATATNGPTPKNPMPPQPSHYICYGARWVEHFDFQWDCYMGEGVPKVWAPAKSCALTMVLWRDLPGAPLNPHATMKPGMLRVERTARPVGTAMTYLPPKTKPQPPQGAVDGGDDGVVARLPRGAPARR